jgi:hypothetical protein
MAGSPSTQEHLPIAGIQDGVLIMTDGSVRAVLRVEPINFDLKSDTEQNAIIYSYQGFLNSLDFPIQIVVQSKKLDLERYLMRLAATQKEMTNDLLRIQIEDYVGFVRRLISVANIMSKRFYIVISYTAITKKGSVAQFSSIFHRQATGPVMDQDQFTRFRTEVFNRAGIIGGGIGRLGVKSELLDTQQLIELFYNTYNPDVATEERLTDVDTLSAGIVSSPDTIPGDQAVEPAAAPPTPEAPAPVATTAPEPTAPAMPAPATPVPEVTPEPIAPAPITPEPAPVASFPASEPPLDQPVTSLTPDTPEEPPASIQSMEPVLTLPEELTAVNPPTETPTP